MSWASPTQTERNLFEKLREGWGNTNPLYRLVRCLSPALRIEPRLLRNLRLRLVANSDSTLEHALWFSPLIATRNRRAVTFFPGCARLLADELADKEPEAYHDSVRLISKNTRHWSSLEILEQESRFRENERKVDVNREFRSLLRKVVQEPDSEKRLDYARWTKGGLPKLDISTLGPEADWLFQYATAALGNTSDGLLRKSKDVRPIPDWLAQKLPAKSSRVGLRLYPGILECVEAGICEQELELPGPLPATLRLSCQGTSVNEAQWISVWPGKKIALPSNCRSLTLQALNGSHWELRVKGNTIKEGPSIDGYRYTSDSSIGNYRYNAFISYAWRDNLSLEENGKGWVSVFVDRLGKLLERELPRALSQDGIWLDYEQMRGSDRIGNTVREALQQSRLLVPILSKGWLDSPWCQDELRIFLHQHGPNSGRIFPIWMDSVEDLPEPLDDLLKYQFWYQDEAKQPRIRWFPEPDPTDRDYSRIQQDLARDMAKRLWALADAKAPQPSDVPEEPVAATDAITDHIRPKGKHRVFINGGDDDWELIQAVAEHLYEDHGVGYFLPLRQNSGLKSSEVIRDLRDKLSLCNNVLLVYDQGPEHQVQRHITEILRAIPRRLKSAPPLDISLCIPHGTNFGFKPPGMRIFECSGPELADCARQLAAALAQPAEASA
uniref:TIR domain-containing protein n=1 Tax=Candidatus Kentrum sp. FW TaxID=2126338 RepID=A0A450TWZ5_9GAMM|nr:MAG: TIR domain-containing protein [Candidatus Kentron sp. FW]